MSLSDITRPGLSILLVLFSALTMTQYVNCSSAGHPTLVFKNLYSILFSDSSIESLQQCLRNRHVEMCRHGYLLNRTTESPYQYEADEMTRSKNLTNTADTGDTMVCQPGGFTTRDSINCVRSSGSLDWCKQELRCFPYHIDYLACGSCDSNCINVGWLGYSVSHRDFKKHSKFLKGVCETKNGTKVEPGELIPSTTSNQTPEALKNTMDDERTSLRVAAITGWTVVAAAIFAVAVAYFIYRKRQLKQDDLKTKSAPPRSQPNAYVGEQGESCRERLPRASNTCPVNGEIEQYGDDEDIDDDYMVYNDAEEDDYTVIEDEQTFTSGRKIPLDGRATMLKFDSPKNILKTTSNFKETKLDLVLKNVMKGRPQGEDRVALNETSTAATRGKGPNNSEQGAHEREEDDGYTRLTAGRLLCDSKATDSMLATYNTASQPHNRHSGATQSHSRHGGAKQPHSLNEVAAYNTASQPLGHSDVTDNTASQPHSRHGGAKQPHSRNEVAAYNTVLQSLGHSEVATDNTASQPRSIASKPHSHSDVATHNTASKSKLDVTNEKIATYETPVATHSHTDKNATTEQKERQGETEYDYAKLSHCGAGQVRGLRDSFMATYNTASVPLESLDNCERDAKTQP